jgi:fatty acid desaturase
MKVLADLQDVRLALRELGLEEQLRALERPRRLHFTIKVAESWVIAFGLAGLVTHYPTFAVVVPSLAVLATRQRALGNNLHDGTHCYRPGALARWLLAAPLFESYARYRTRHLKHHAYLGVRGKDPDLVELPAGRRSSWALYAKHWATPQVWLENLIGDLVLMPWRDRLGVAFFWIALAAGAGLAFGPRFAASFLLLWFGARLTFYSAIKCFTELSDHFGLAPGSVLGFTRNAPVSWLNAIFHPQNDGWHLTHHIAPSVPMAHLARAHALLMHVGRYADSNHCDAYFFGPRSIAGGWVKHRDVPVPRPSGRISVEFDSL